MYLDIDMERAVPAFQKLYKSHLRCNPMDSSSLKGFAGLNDTQYERFGRAFFYFTGLRCLAPIKDVCELRVSKEEKDYSTMVPTPVDMTRVNKKGGLAIS